MAYSPISLLVPQYEDLNGEPYVGAVLKAYAAGTTTPIAMATDSTGGTTFTSISLDSSGYPDHSNNIVIPHVNEDYKISLYPDQTAADANTGAIFTIDNLTPIWGDSAVGLLTYTLNESGAVERTVEDRLYDLASISDFGAVGDGVTDDTSAIDTSPEHTYVPFGDWEHADTAFFFDHNVWGPGTIRTSEGKRRGHNVFRLDAAPTLSSGTSIATYFDTMPTLHSYDIQVTGSDTCGEPSTGYLQSDETHPIFYAARFESGHNESATTADGRTGWSMQRSKLSHVGDGDAHCQSYSVLISNSDLTSTGLLANKAAGFFNGQIFGLATNSYVNGFELNVYNSTDEGTTAYDIFEASVFNYYRYTATEDLGSVNADNFWAGLRFQSNGNTPCESMLQPAGQVNAGWTWSLDHSANVGRCDIGLKAEDRIYLDVTPVVDTTMGGVFNKYAQSVGQKYISHVASTNFFRIANMNLYCDGGITANLGIGDAHPTTANGDISFVFTDNTTLTITGKGSDGTDRSVALTLA